MKMRMEMKVKVKVEMKVEMEMELELEAEMMEVDCNYYEAIDRKLLVRASSTVMDNR